MTAREIMGELDRITRSVAWREAPAGAALARLHRTALSRAVEVSESNARGYGDATFYRYPDGSVLVDDGRGYTTEAGTLD